MYHADVIVVGGGSAGVAAAVASAREGAKTILIEKNGYLGGTATASLVTPMMPNQAKGKNLSEGIYREVLEGLRSKYGGAERFSDNNQGWVNPEFMKIYLDEVCSEAGVELFFNMELIGVVRHDPLITGLECMFNGIKVRFSAKYYIDASGNADLSYLAGVPMLSDPGSQAITLRFMMGGIDLDRLAEWLKEVDPEMKNSALFNHPEAGWMLTTAYVSDRGGEELADNSEEWLLYPYFKAGIEEGLITRAEAVYFQIFSLPGMPGVVSFNSPRIESSEPLDPLNPRHIEYAYRKGRQQIVRLVNFCKAKLPGFEKSFLSHIAHQIGIRESRRIKGRYVLTDIDILACQKFPGEAVARSSYPIDVHQASPSADKGGLQRLKEGDYYEIPFRSLQPENIDNLLVAGRCISASFLAQSSLRIQAVCWSMGESAGKRAAGNI